MSKQHEAIRAALSKGAKTLNLRRELGGPLSPDIGQLTPLLELDLGFNNLSELPPEVGNLTQLLRLNLSHNNLATLPPGFGRLERLEQLDLGKNRLTLLPQEIGQLTQLQELDLSCSGFSFLSGEIGNLTQLRSLKLKNTDLTALPREIGQLTQLQHLDLSHSNLKLLPPEIGQLSQLRHLDLSHTHLRSLPRDIGQLTQLQHLDLSHTDLAALPRDIGHLTQLRHLALKYTDLSVLPREIGQLTQLPELNLSGTELSSLPPEIGQLSKLRKLEVYGNQLAELPPEIGELAGLQRLAICGCKLRNLPPEIGQLTQLEELTLSSNPLRELPAEIGHLAKLQKLGLDRTSLRVVPPEIGQLTQLVHLYIGGTKIESLPPEIGHLSQLQTLAIGNITQKDSVIHGTTITHRLILDPSPFQELTAEVGRLARLRALSVSDSELRELPSAIGELTQLQTLDLGRTQLRELPSAIGTCTQLHTLNLDETELSDLPPEIGELAQMQFLSLNKTPIRRLPPEIGRLAQLRYLDLGSTGLRELPKEAAELTELSHLYLHGNDALGIPPEILGQGRGGFGGPTKPQDILDFLLRSPQQAPEPLLEAKILIVGQGGVGKTSLVKRLVEDVFDPGESKTEGIDIARWAVPARQSPQKIRVNIWDFGGQEIMHATHQFFLTERSLYLLVVDAREGQDKSRLHYWLHIIQSFGGDAPILVITNKCDASNYFEMNETGLQKRYAPNIRGFYRTSCQSGSGIPALASAIQHEIENLEHVYSKAPSSFIAAKKKLEEQTQLHDYLDISKFRAICQEQEITQRREQQQLLRFLHDLGSVLHFSDPDSPYQLDNTKVLNPEWVTRGVYKVLNNLDLMRKSGVLTIREMAKILTKEDGYSKSGRLFILGMMRKFELCFDFPDQSQRLLLPELLARNEPDLALDENRSLRFEYHYAILPDGLLPRFIVRTHHYLTEKPTLWHTGVLLEVEGNRALVRADTQAQRVSICIFDTPKGRRRALAYIRGVFNGIHQTIPGLEAEQRVPLPSGGTASYDHLVWLESEGHGRYSPEGSRQFYSVQQLLDGIEEPEQRNEGSNTVVLGDQYNIKGQAAGVGRMASAEKVTLQQVSPDDLDLRQLARELARLRQALPAQASEPEHYRSLAEVAVAEQAAEKGMGRKALEHLERAGQWAYGEAKEVGLELVVEVMKRMILDK